MCALHHHPAGHQYWTPVEKLILHLSPVTKRKSVKNLGKQVTKQRDRRTRSEPSDQQQQAVGRPACPGGTAGRAARNILRRANVSSSSSSNCDGGLNGRGGNGSVSSGSLSSPASDNGPSSAAGHGTAAARASPNFSNELHTMKYYGLNKVETELIDKLDILVSENKGDHEYKHLFNAILMENITSRDPVWRENGAQFVTSVSKLLERLLDYRSVIQGEQQSSQSGAAVDGPKSESSLDQRMSCTVNLLNFYGSSCESKHRRQEMYLRYVYKLHDLHMQVPNYTEAGFTLKLHSDLLQWTNRTLHADLRFPTQKEWQRKEDLYMKIIEYFEKGKQWEHAIPMCKELCKVYEEKVFDFAKLSDLLKRQASLFEKVLSKSEENLRLDPEYFRVGFYGKGFPLFLRNKEFIYRGLDWEKISTFTQRICAEFPGSQLLSSNTPPDERTRESDSQFVQICCVKPVPNLIVVQKQQAAMEGYTVPDPIRSFYLTNDVQSFQYDRPFHKGCRDKDNEFKTLWVERSTYMTTSQLPGILRWFEVEKVAVDEITPIDHACETVAAKNAELRHLAATAESCKNSGLKLTQTLQGVIDAAVNGGVSKYANAFFTSSYVESHDLGKVQRLHDLLMEQVNVLESALTTHQQLASAEIRPLHDHLMERFAGMRASLPHQINCATTPSKSGRKSKIVNTPLPPLPQHRSPRGSLDNESNYYSAMTLGPAVAGIAERIIPISVEENIYSRPQQHNLMTTSCPPATLNALRSNTNITTPSRYNSQRALQLCSDAGDGPMVYGNPSSMALAVNLASVQRCSNMSSSSSSGSCGSEATIPPRPPATNSFLRKKMAPPKEVSAVHHSLHQRDSGHASIGSSEDLAPPLPPRYSAGSFNRSSPTSRNTKRSSLYHDGSSSSSTSTLNQRISNDLRDEDYSPLLSTASSSSSSCLMRTAVPGQTATTTSLVPPPIPPKTSSVSPTSSEGADSGGHSSHLFDGAPAAAAVAPIAVDDDLVLFIDEATSPIADLKD